MPACRLRAGSRSHRSRAGETRARRSGLNAAMAASHQSVRTENDTRPGARSRFRRNVREERQRHLWFGCRRDAKDRRGHEGIEPHRAFARTSARHDTGSDLRETAYGASCTGERCGPRAWRTGPGRRVPCAGPGDGTVRAHLLASVSGGCGQGAHSVRVRARPSGDDERRSRGERLRNDGRRSSGGRRGGDGPRSAVRRRPGALGAVGSSRGRAPTSSACGTGMKSLGRSISLGSPTAPMDSVRCAAARGCGARGRTMRRLRARVRRWGAAGRPGPWGRSRAGAGMPAGAGALRREPGRGRLAQGRNRRGGIECAGNGRRQATRATGTEGYGNMEAMWSGSGLERLTRDNWSYRESIGQFQPFRPGLG